MKNSLTMGGLAFACVIGIVISVMFGAVIYLNNEISACQTQVEKQQKQLTILKSENTRLDTLLIERLDEENIIEYAENTLGMKRISAYQVYYIKSEKSDKVTVKE